MRRFLQSEKLREEFLKLLTGTTIEITAQVRLAPHKPQGETKPGVSVADISVRRGKRSKKA